MHTHFSDWYRVARLEPKGEDIPKRWTGVESLTKELDAPKAMDSVRVFLGMPPVSASFLDGFRATFQKADAAFPMRDNDVELRVLAGATMINFLSTKGTTPIASALAIATISSSWQGMRKDVLVPDVWESAAQFLFDTAVRLRVSTVPDVTFGGPKNDDLLTEVKASLTADALAHPFQKLNNATGSLAKSTIEAMTKVTYALKALREESDILWWVFGRTSRDTKKRFSERKIPEACILVGKELADIALIVPGPIAVPAIVDRLLADSFSDLPAKITVDSAVDAAGAEWKAKVMSETSQQAGGLTILHSALGASSQNSGWKSSFQSPDGFNLENITFTPSQIALQMYNERLLHRLLLSAK